MEKNKQFWWQNLNTCKIVLASDHAGFKLKMAIKEWLTTTSFQLFDVGTDSKIRTDYPVIIQKAAHVFQTEKAQFAILICGSGIGVNMVANRYRFWRAYRFCTADQTGLRLARQHNDANVITFGGRLTRLSTAQKAIISFLTTDFSTVKRYQNRLKMF